jgi:hypothetical protein
MPRTVRVYVRVVETTLFSRKERRRTTLGLGIFEKHLCLGFALKIFCHLLFYMTNFKKKFKQIAHSHRADSYTGRIAPRASREGGAT